MIIRLYKLYTTTLLLLATSSFAQNLPSAPVRQEPGLKVELEQVYHQWIHSMASKDLRTWESVMASYRRIQTRNRIISQNHPFPNALFEEQIGHPDLNNLFLLTILSRRDTASAIYFGKPGALAGNSTNSILVLRYVKENGRWLFDNIRVVRINDNPEVLHQISQRDLSFLSAEEFQPLDGVPPIPPLVGPPELLGELWATSVGFETEIWINNYPMGKIKNGSGKELVMGGVRRGQNVVRIRSTPLPGIKGQPKIEIGIYAAKGAGEAASRVFHYGPRNTIEQAEITTGFSGKSITIE